MGIQAATQEATWLHVLLAQSQPSRVHRQTSGVRANASAESGQPRQRDIGRTDSGRKMGEGVEVKNADAPATTTRSANQNYREEPQGHLLLAHGTMDDNVPPNNTSDGSGCS